MPAENKLRKKPVNKSPTVQGNNKDHINPALAAGDTSDIVNEESDALNNNNKTTIKGNATKVLKRKCHC